MNAHDRGTVARLAKERAAGLHDERASVVAGFHGGVAPRPYFFLGSSAAFTNRRSLGPTPWTCTMVSCPPAHAKCG